MRKIDVVNIPSSFVRFTATAEAIQWKADEHKATTDAVRRALEAKLLTARNEHKHQEAVAHFIETNVPADLDNIRVSTSGTMVDPYSFPQLPEQSKTKLQDAANTPSGSMRKQGRGATNRERAERMALKAMAALVNATTDLDQWADDYSPQDLFLLEYGDEELGLGGCVIEPETYLLLWECLATPPPRC